MFPFVEKLSTIILVWKINVIPQNSTFWMVLNGAKLKSCMMDEHLEKCLKVTTFPKYATPLPGNNGSKGE